MTVDNQKRFPWDRLILIGIIFFVWASSRLYRDYAEAGQWESSSIISVGITFFITLFMGIIVFGVMNRTNPKDKQ